MKRTRKPLILALGTAVAALTIVASAFGMPGNPYAAMADFIVAYGVDPVLDPSLIPDIASENVALNLFEGLMQYDPETSRAIPAMAESWWVSENGLVYTFALRKATWSDGKPITAGDFVYAMRRILDPALPKANADLPKKLIKGAAEYNAGLLSFDEVGIKALDERTLRFTLRKPAPYFIETTARSAFWPLPRQAIEAHGATWTKPDFIVTNGPYRLYDWKPGKMLFLQKNPKYWDSAHVRLRGILFLTTKDWTAGFRQYLAGDIDWMLGVKSPAPDGVREHHDYHVSARFGTCYLSLNMTHPPATDPLVRTALATAIDRIALVRSLAKERFIVTESLVPPLSGYSAQTGLTFDPVKARERLAQAGYPGGKGFPQLVLYFSAGGTNEAIARCLQEQWKTVLGIPVTLKKLDSVQFLSLRSGSHDYSAVIDGWIGDCADPAALLERLVTGSETNYACYSSPEYDSFVAAARTSYGIDQSTLLEKAEALLLGDAAIIPLFNYANEDLVDAEKWEGWFPSPLGIHPLKAISRR